MRSRFGVVVLSVLLITLAGCGGSGRDNRTYRCSDGIIVSQPVYCSGHGGIAPATARCADGTYTNSTAPDNYCASHGGVDVHF